jgi:hypothetical protein
VPRQRRRQPQLAAVPEHGDRAREVERAGVEAADAADHPPRDAVGRRIAGAKQLPQ